MLKRRYANVPPLGILLVLVISLLYTNISIPGSAEPQSSTAAGVTITTISCPTIISTNVTFVCTVTVSPESATGTVDFDIQSGFNGYAFGLFTCVLTGGSCNESLNYSGIGAECDIEVMAIYLGDVNHLPSSSIPSMMYLPSCDEASVSTFLTFTCRDSILVVGTPTVCTVVIPDFVGSLKGDQIGISGSGSFNSTGCVIVYDSCSVTYTPTQVGLKVLGAYFGGDNDQYGNGGDAGMFALVAVSSLSLSPPLVSVSCPLYTAVNSSIKCTASVSGISATGTVVFEVASGTNLLKTGYCVLSGESCSKEFAYNDSVHGNKVAVVAAYQGDSTIAPGYSNPVTVVVTGYSNECFSSTSASSVTLKKFCLPPGTIAIALAYLNGYAYYASQVYGFVIKVNTLTGNYTIISKPEGYYNRPYYGAAIDPVGGNLWLTRFIAGNDNYPPGVSVVSLTTGLVTDVLNGSSFVGIGIVGGYAYAASGKSLFKISLAPPYNHTEFSLAGDNVTGSFHGFVGDPEGNVWFTDEGSGRIYEFDPLTNSTTVYSGFNMPIGIAVSSSTVYVAEYCPSTLFHGNPFYYDGCLPSIAQMPLAGGSISRTLLGAGAPFDVVIASGLVVWSSDADDWGHTTTICVLNGECISTGEANFFMTTDPSGNVYFSYFGSSGVGEISGFKASPTVSISCSASYVTIGSSGYAKCDATVKGDNPKGRIVWSHSGSGSVRISPASCNLVKGACSVTVSVVKAGTVVINGTYKGDSLNLGAFSTHLVTIRKASPTVYVTCKMIPGLWICAASVKGYSPTGTISWSQIGTNAVTFSAKMCALANGSCSVTVDGFVKGSVTIVGAYSGDGDNLASHSIYSLTVSEPLPSPL